MSTLETKSWSTPDESMTPDKPHAATIKFAPLALQKQICSQAGNGQSVSSRMLVRRPVRPAISEF